MQRKLNEDFIKEYSREFSQKVASIFFSENEIITGKEILSVTPSRQVNFFILKILFRKWQEEMKRLESPYFNYKDNQVRRAMVDLMNMLSQHIEVHHEAFEMLLAEAVEDTLILCIAPDLYLRRELDQREISVVTEKVTKPIHKYLKLYRDQFDEFFSDNVGEPHDIFLENAEAFFSLTDQAIENELGVLSKTSPVSLEDLLPHDETPEEIEELTPPLAVMDEDDEAEAMRSFEEEGMDEQVEQTGPGNEDVWEEESIEVSESDPEDLSIDREDDEDELPLTEENERVDEPDENDVRPEGFSSAPGPGLEPDEDDAQIAPQIAEEPEVDEQLTEEPATINDRFTEKEQITMADKLQEKRVDNIMEAISVNHRYMFTKELFEGDRDEFNRAISEIEECASFDDAVEMLVQNHAKERDWDMNSEEVKELLKVVFRKFR